MTVVQESWGTRLSDAVRCALREQNFARALQLANQGDGHSRDLAQEFAFMLRGLFGTLGVLFPLLERCASELASDERAAAAAERSDVLQALCRGLQETAPPQPSAPAALAALCARAQARLLADQRGRADAVIAALERADAPTALTQLDEKDAAYRAPHDALVRFMAQSFAWVHKHFGEAGLTRFHLETAEGQRAGFLKWERLSPAEFAATTAFLLKQHLGQVRVHEGAETFTIEQSPCGSGGRLLQQGAYHGPGALPYATGPAPLTFGRAKLPVYCTHCAIWNGLATLRWFGRAQWVFDDAARPDGGCRLQIYKTHSTPEDYVRMLTVGTE